MFSEVLCSLAFFFNKLCFVQFKHRFPSVFFFSSVGSWLVFIVH